MNTKSLLAAITSALIIGSAQAATVVVYEDTFDNDGLATNTGIGGGMAQRTILDTVISDNGNLVSSTSGGNSARAVVSTINSFDLSEGFILTVTFEGDTTNIMESFGLSTTQFSSHNNGQDWLRDRSWSGGSATHTEFGIGVQSGEYALQTGESSMVGVAFNDGAQNVTSLLSTTAQEAAGQNTVVLTVNTSDQFTYSVNGSLIGSGEIVSGSGTFDLSDPFYFNAYVQSDSTISYVKIEAVPEPGSLALLGLGGLCVMRRRRA